MQSLYPVFMGPVLPDPGSWLGEFIVQVAITQIAPSLSCEEGPRSLSRPMLSQQSDMSCLAVGIVLIVDE
jgi:hypothetical protein